MKTITASESRAGSALLPVFGLLVALLIFGAASAFRVTCFGGLGHGIRLAVAAPAQAPAKGQMNGRPGASSVGVIAQLVPDRADKTAEDRP